MKNIIIYTISLIFFFQLPLYGEKKQLTFDNLLGYSKNNIKIVKNTPKKTLLMIETSLSEIRDELTDESFKEYDQIENIKKNLEKCLEEKCYNFMKLAYQKKPLKLEVLENIETLEKLSIQYNKFASKKEESENKRNLAKKDDYEKVLAENQKLRKRMEKVMISYDKRIKTLEDENNELEKKNKELFDMLAPYKKRKLKN